MTPKAERAKAYRQVRSAMESGGLVRPAQCSRCDSIPSPGKDGRSQIHAHHEDHSKPLEVEWLCVMCHNHATPQSVGERHGQARLTEDDVRLIRTSHESAHALARKLGVSLTTVSHTRRNRLWKHVSLIPAEKEK